MEISKMNLLELNWKNWNSDEADISHLKNIFVKLRQVKNNIEFSAVSEHYVSHFGII